VNRDFRDLLAEFNAQGVEYLLVGAHALAAHGHVRATKDLDVWIRPDAENAKRVITALRAFGAPLHDLTEADLTTPGLIFQIGVPPVRIDVLTAIDGVDFAEAWSARLLTQFADCVRVLLCIILTCLSCFLRRYGLKTPRPHQVCHQHVYIFVQIEFNEQATHGFFTSGSMRCSGIRLRSISVFTSPWWSL
jgi:hypothetical protein